MWEWIKQFFGYHKVEVKEDLMKYLIIGLGNMDPKYDNTRHNVGFDVVDVMAEKAGAAWKLGNLGAVTEIKHRGRKLILLKPSTYMNRSGKAVNYWMQKEKVPVDRIMVVVDDLNLQFGTLRMRGKGSDGGHNGLKDIQQYIGAGYPRLRVGIGDDFHQGQQVNYVLGKWSVEERKNLLDILEKCDASIKAFTTIGLGRAMSQYNG